MSVGSIKEISHFDELIKMHVQSFAEKVISRLYPVAKHPEQRAITVLTGMYQTAFRGHY